MKKTRLNLTAKVAFTSLCILAWLVVFQTGLAEEKVEDILTKVATPIKDIANMQELEGTTFHVINITEHDSVLPAELRLGGTEADWAEGIIGYVDGKEIPTGLLSSDNGIRLMVSVPLKPKEVKKVTFKKGKAAATTDLKVEQDGNRVVVANKQAKWQLGPSGMEQFQRSGKTFSVQETGISNGTLKATLTPAACRVTLSAEGGPAAREYLFYPNSSLWQVNADRSYQVVAGGKSAFYYSHPCTVFFGDPGSVGADFETSDLEKGGGGVKGLKEFHLFSAADWGLLMDNAIGLGVYPNPSAHTILVDTSKRPQSVIVQAVPINERSAAVIKQWHKGGEDRYGGCGWWRVQNKPLGSMIDYVFGAAADVGDGRVQRSASLAPVLLRSIGNRLHGTQLPWTTASRSETLLIEDLDGAGPDMLNDRWYWCDNGKPMSSFAFHDPNKDGLLDAVEIYANWDNKGGTLDSSELKYPVCALHDQTRDGKIVPNCVFFGGRVDQDWFEFNSGIDWSPPARQLIGREKDWRSVFGGWPEVKMPALEALRFDRHSRALDLDGDGDLDIMASSDQGEEPDTDYKSAYGRQELFVDVYDYNPFHGISMDPLTGNLVVKFTHIYPCYLGHAYVGCFRYKGVPVVGSDALMGNICLDGDGLPEGKLEFDGALYGDDFFFRPTLSMVASSLYLDNRHALRRINNFLWQEGDPGNHCFRLDVGLFTIRKNSGWPSIEPAFKNARMIPKRPVKDCITTYRDKWGNETQFVGIELPAKWDGRLVDGSKDPAIVKDWSDSFHYDWDYLMAGFDGPLGCLTEAGYPTHFTRWEFCPDYAQRRQVRLFYSELDGRLHLKGALWGQRSPYMYNPVKKAPLDELGKTAKSFVHEGYFILDCDFMRYYSACHEAFFDDDQDGYLDCFLVDADNDGWYEDRAWYDAATRTVYCMKGGSLVCWPQKLDPYPEEEMLLENYDRLVALKRMSEERTSVLKGTTIKTQPLSISVPGTNLWLGVGADLLPQVLLDTAHCEAGIWRDLSPKGYSRLLTGLQRQKAVVQESREKWSDESLRGASVLFVAPPYTAKPEADELKALDAFLKSGGKVVVACPDWSNEPIGEAYALRTDKPLVPDGKTGEWAGPQGIELALKWDTPPEPYRVKINVCPKWDKTYFYLYAEVHDRDLINKGSDADIWKGDCIQFALGDLGAKWEWFKAGWGSSLDERTSAMGAKGMKWQEYGIARTDKGPQIYRWIDVPGNRTGPVAGAKLEVVRQENRTIYQLALPWTEVGKADARSGSELGFSLVVWDRANDREMQYVIWGGGIVPNKDSTLFRKLILADTADAINASAGARVDSHLDAFCASYGISRNNERTALAPAIDPQFRQRELGSDVSARFNGDRSGGMMKDVRKLFFNGSSLSVSGSAASLVLYQDKIIAAKAGVGKGELLVLCSEMILNNRYSCFHSFEGGGGYINERPLDKLLDAKPDNNVFADNLARYVVADRKKFKVLKAGDAHMTVELAVPGNVYVNKATKVTPGGKEIINGKENGDTMCFEVSASKAPIKLKISR